METLREATASNSRLKVSAKKVKTFVLDTNVLLHDPQSIYKFEDNNLAIPVEVLEELDFGERPGITGHGASPRGMVRNSTPNRRAPEAARFFQRS